LFPNLVDGSACLANNVLDGLLVDHDFNRVAVHDLVVASFLNELNNLLANLLHIILGTTNDDDIRVVLGSRNPDRAVIELIIHLPDSITLLANHDLVEPGINLNFRHSQVSLKKKKKKEREGGKRKKETREVRNEDKQQRVWRQSYQVLERLGEVLFDNLDLVLVSNNEGGLVFVIIMWEDNVSSMISLDLLDGLAVLANNKLPELSRNFNFLDFEFFLVAKNK
jgi:hypothetical protein